MSEQEILAMMTLTRIPAFSLINAHMLIEQTGSATAVMEHRHDIRDIVPDASDRLVKALSEVDEARRRAEAEWDFAQRKHIRCLPFTDEHAYPQLLTQCADAPLMLYYLGNANLNAQRIVSIVGTRKITEYGKDLCRQFVKGLHDAYPDTVIISGLAYGVDIHSHRAALEQGMPTVAVLAHGLDTIYPAIHRQTAVRMLEQGGLLTEYMSQTPGDKGNFVRRNRIIAGISVATVVVESAIKGGALITADLAAEYNREVCAFPGRTFDEYSAGCNHLIHSQNARLITSVDDFLDCVGWPNPKKEDKAAPSQQELFPQLTVDEQRIVRCLEGIDSKQINQICIEANIPFALTSAILFELELKGIVKVLGGARYRLITSPKS
ncbi:MAG: DNA-processing protein DprA [Bacteroidaceae bacterium]|nr:DNA-processing protein DprA [Bacteroidaceae bacterium]